MCNSIMIARSNVTMVMFPQGVLGFQSLGSRLGLLTDYNPIQHPFV